MESKIAVISRQIAMGLLLVTGPQNGWCDEKKITEGPHVSESVSAKLETLFQEHYPNATFDNQGVNGLHCEYEVFTIDSYYSGTKGVKREAVSHRGPKPGGILCSVYAAAGPYRGQLQLSPFTEGKLAQQVIDRKEYKQLLMAPYSKKTDIHLWAALSFPPDVNDEFLDKFRRIMMDFQKETK
jgi:hypothetical protein